MLDNNAYNIMRQIVEEHTSLWRIKDDYLKDAESDTTLGTVWNQIAAEKERDIDALVAELKERI